MKYLFNRGTKLLCIFLYCTMIVFSCDSEENSSTNDCEGEDCSITCEDGYRVRLGECVPDVDDDRDFDGVPDAGDNCPDTANADQRDCDQDGIGDLCDDESLCGITLSGSISRYDVYREEDRALGEALVETVGFPIYTETSAEGQYRMGLYSPGDYNVLVFAPEEESEEMSPRVIGRFPVTIQTQPSATQTQDWHIDPPGDIIGSVKFEGSSPYEGVHGGIGVYIKEVPFKTDITDRGGHFELRRVPPGPITLVFVYPGYQPKEVQVQVKSLSTISVIPDVDDSVLNPLTGEETWGHEVVVNISNSEESIDGSFDATLQPVFPHLTQPVELSLSGSGEGEIITLRTEATHQVHDVFMLSITDQVKRSSAYNIASPINQTNQLTELNTEGLPDGWEDYNTQLNQIEQMPLNNEPYTGPQTLMEYEFLSPLALISEKGDQFTLHSVSYVSDSSVEVLAQTRQSSWRFPLQYKYREIALALTSSAEVVFDQAELAQMAAESTLRIDMSINKISERQELKLAVANDPCWLGQDNCDYQITTIDLRTCAEEAREYRCQVELDREQPNEQLRVWVYDNVEQSEYEISLLSCDQCMNEFGLEDLEIASSQFGFQNYPVPVYPMLARSISANSDDECRDDGEAFRTPLASTTTQPEFCFPELPIYYPIETASDACLSQSVFGSSGRPLVITNIDVTTVPVDRARPLSDLLGVDLLGNFVRAGTSQFNPFIIFDLFHCRGHCVGGMSTAVGALVTLTLTDGIQDQQYSFDLYHQGSPGSPALPYCWSFEEDPRYSF